VGDLLKECEKDRLLASIGTCVIISIALVLPTSHSSAYGSVEHSSIVIDGNAAFTVANGVTGGSGTALDPFIIEGWLIYADGVTGRSVDITNTDAFFAIRNLTAYGTISLSNVSNGTITEVNILCSGKGFWIVSCEAIGISKCEVFSYASESVWSDQTGNLTISENRLNGVRMESCGNLTFDDNVLTEVGAGVAVVGCSDVRVANNTLRSTTYSGDLDVIGCTNVTVAGNLFSNGTGGLMLWWSQAVTVSENIFESTGIYIGDYSADEWSAYEISQDNLVNGKPVHYYKAGSDLVLDNMTVGELIVGNYTDVWISNLTISASYCGILMGFVENASITGVNVSANHYGICMRFCNNTTIVGCAFWSNSHGIEMYECCWSSIYHNHFLYNGEHALSYGSGAIGNMWDAGYPAGGNYWSNYTGSDNYNGPDQDIAGADGIGDAPFVGSGGVVDRYPWMAEDMTNIPEFGTMILPILGALAVVVLGTASRRSRRTR